MSCYRCADKFGLFKKETGCGNCGFSFCPKCCSNKINVPKKDNKKLNVCVNCFQVLSNPPSSKDHDSTAGARVQQHHEMSPPKNLLKLMESNKSKEQSGVDHALAARLEKLNAPKENKNPSEAEIRERLLKLQGRTQQHAHLSNLPSKDNVKTSNDLIKKLTEEVDLNARDEEYEKLELQKLEERLKSIKEFTSNRPTTNSKDGATKSEEKNDEPIDVRPASSASHGASSEIKKSQKVDSDDDEIVRKMLDEAEKSYKSKVLNEKEELWCAICNDDANFRCVDCDDDMYCNRCFKETHKGSEYRTHKKKEL